MEKKQKVSDKSQLKRVLNSKNIDFVVFDLDGTILDTPLVFQTAIKKACTILVNGNIDEAVSLIEKTREIIGGLRTTFQVNPTIMFYSINLAAKIAQVPDDDPRILEALSIVSKIYTTDRYSVFPGAIETIETFSAIKHSTLATHGSWEYTYWKRAHTGLIGKFDKVLCFDIDIPKAESWESQLYGAGIDPASTLVVEDNYDDGIAPMLNLGAFACWINKKLDGDPYMESERLLVVRTIDQVIPALLEKTASS